MRDEEREIDRSALNLLPGYAEEVACHQFVLEDDKNRRSGQQVVVGGPSRGVVARVWARRAAIVTGAPRAAPTQGRTARSHRRGAGFRTRRGGRSAADRRGGSSGMPGAAGRVGRPPSPARGPAPPAQRQNRGRPQCAPGCAAAGRSACRCAVSAGGRSVGGRTHAASAAGGITSAAPARVRAARHRLPVLRRPDVGLQPACMA